MISEQCLRNLKVFLWILFLNSNEAFQGGNLMHRIVNRNQISSHPKSGLIGIKPHASSKSFTYLRQSSLILLRDTSRSSGGVSEQVYKEFDQAVELNDLLLVEDLVMVSNSLCIYFDPRLPSP